MFISNKITAYSVIKFKNKEIQLFMKISLDFGRSRYTYSLIKIFSWVSQFMVYFSFTTSIVEKTKCLSVNNNKQVLGAG